MLVFLRDTCVAVIVAEAETDAVAVAEWVGVGVGVRPTIGLAAALARIVPKAVNVVVLVDVVLGVAVWVAMSEKVGVATVDNMVELRGFEEQ